MKTLLDRSRISLEKKLKYENSSEMCICLWAEFGRPGVTLCG